MLLFGHGFSASAFTASVAADRPPSFVQTCRSLLCCLIELIRRDGTGHGKIKRLSNYHTMWPNPPPKRCRYAEKTMILKGFAFERIDFQTPVLRCRNAAETQPERSIFSLLFSPWDALPPIRSRVTNKHSSDDGGIVTGALEMRAER